MKQYAYGGYCLRGVYYLPDGQVEPMPWTPNYPGTWKITQYTFWELARRTVTMLGGIDAYVAAGAGDFLGKASTRELCINLTPGSAEDLRFYQNCLRKAFLWGEQAWDLRRGVVTHQGMANRYRSAQMTYPPILKRVSRVSSGSLRSHPQPADWYRQLLEGA